MRHLEPCWDLFVSMALTLFKLQLTIVAKSSVSVKVTTRVDGVEFVVCTKDI